MKKWIIRLITAFLLVLLIVSGAVYLAAEHESYRNAFAKDTDSTGYTRATVEEIMPYIQEAQTGDDHTKLIVGDSVCHQMFNRFHDKNKEYSAIGSNDAITMAGQFLLVKEYLNTHPDTTDVYLVLRSLGGNGFTNLTWTYGYLVIPFTETDLIRNLDDNTITDLNNIFGKFFMKKRVVTDIDNSPMLKKLFINHLKPNEYDNVGLGIQYLAKMEDVCSQQGVQLHFIHAPVSEACKSEVSDEKAKALAEVKLANIRELIDDYYDSVLYYPAEYFRDGVHFSDKHGSDDDIAEYIAKMQKNDGMRGFVTVDEEK